MLILAGNANEELNPGISFDVVVVFDVSDAGSIVSAELHDSPFSGGVVVDLSR